ncbi:MAG: alpha-1,3/4-fucosidase [Muribaculaceae bacterium]|nr:alpha-1,3/4-fucosidase [Muribaculaceae bacterium]
MKKLIFLPMALGLVSAVCANDSIPYANTIKIWPTDSKEVIVAKAAHVVPTPQQYEALKDEFIGFLHFGPNTFTRREWGTGFEDPKVFAPATIDADQWVKTMKDAGMTKVILTAKHHDGFVLWQSRYTKHGIMSSDYAGGKGDVMRAVADACAKYGMKLGVYLSPADLYQIENEEGLYGNLSPKTLRTIPRAVEGRPFENKTTFEFVVDDYNEYYLNQLFELLTEYGPIHEVWLDGAHPKRKGGQTYNYPAWKELIHTLAPDAIVFGREDARWCGNESGDTRSTEWNVIPYEFNPDTAANFHDLTDMDLGSREKLYAGKFLHYQHPETDVSIREGWFYRDDDRQKVRSADDLFDIYERSVGGNATFLLNIPPNREGRFSDRDVASLLEAGRRIRETYGVNLLAGAKAAPELLDSDLSTAVSAAKPIELTFSKPTTINRLVLHEPVTVSGERIEEVSVDAWQNGAWKEIAKATNVGYKRILRFPDVTTSRLRIRVLSSRLEPGISEVSAHYYKAHAPELTVKCDAKGMVTIAPRTSGFGWKAGNYNAAENLSAGYKVYYTTDGSTPTVHSKEYTAPFAAAPAVVKAVAVLHGENGPVAEQRTGLPKAAWKVAGIVASQPGHEAEKAFDASNSTYWVSDTTGTKALAIDLGAKNKLTGFAYTPQTAGPQGMIAKGVVEVSNDGKKWKKVEEFEFGNLVNDPSTRYHFFAKPVDARFVRVTPVELAGGSKVAAIAEIDIF